MSTGLHTPEERTTGPSLSQSSKPQRVLACVLCQQRKVKCDRKFPCANCVKFRAQCVPATLTPRRRRRRFPERELLGRLRSYEDLLRQNNIKFEPFHPDSAAEESPNTKGGYDSDDEHPATADADWSSPSTTVESERGHEAKSFWEAIHQGLRDPGNDSDSSSDDVRENIIKASWDQTFEKYDDLLFGSRNNTVDLSTLHPDAVHIFRLWQIYLDNANPLLKVTHTPSLQGRIIEAASNVPNINPNLEALMFSIYCMAVLSLVEEGCEAMFGSSKDDLLFRYQFACRQALMNAGVLRTGERDCLTALYLYSVSVVPRTDPRSLSSMLGIAVRIAQRMGLHSESANVKCTVLEAEMRRRLWWSLVLFDTRICELADSKTSTLAPTWDCKIPLNVNDSDLRPEMKEPPVIQGQSTDALFAVVRSELGDFVRHTLFHLEFTSPALKAIAKDVPEGGETVALEKMIEDRYLKFCNPENPLHFMTLWMARAYLAKCRFMEYFSTFSNPAVAPSETQRDTANSLALSILECDTKMMASPLIKGYLWLLNFYFPFPGYIQVLRDLRRRPIAKHAEHAWEVMSDNYSARLIPLGREAGPFHGILAGMVLEAWEARDAAYREQAEPAMPPRIVSYIRHRLAQAHNNGAAENTDGVTGLDMNDPSSSTPMDFGSPSLLYSMVGQDGYSGMASMGYPTMPAQAATDVDVNQFAWSATDWGLLNLSAGDRTHQAESTWPSPPGQAPASQGP